MVNYNVGVPLNSPDPLLLFLRGPEAFLNRNTVVFRYTGTAHECRSGIAAVEYPDNPFTEELQYRQIEHFEK